MNGWLGALLPHLFNFVFGGVIAFVAIFLIWLSPLGRLISDWEEFQKWKRDQEKK